jgi:serine/threonine protein kinase
MDTAISRTSLQEFTEYSFRSAKSHAAASTRLSFSLMSVFRIHCSCDSIPVKHTNNDASIISDSYRDPPIGDSLRQEVSSDSRKPSQALIPSICERDLETICELGGGSNGIVYKVRQTSTGNLFARKVLSKRAIKSHSSSDILSTERVTDEASILASCSNSPYIVGLKGRVVSRHHGEGSVIFSRPSIGIHSALDSNQSILLEFMDAGSLESVLTRTQQPVPPGIASVIAADVLSGLEHLWERHGILHRDLKPSNILITSGTDSNDRYSIDGHEELKRSSEIGKSGDRESKIQMASQKSSAHAKICDFGEAVRVRGTRAYSVVGTTAYMAPERLRCEPYDIKADIWSLGVIMAEILVGKLPFEIPAEERTALRPLLRTSLENELSDSDLMKGRKDGLAIVELWEAICTEEPPRLDHRFFGSELADFVEKCLQKQPSDRASLYELLHHPIIKLSVEHETAFDRWVKSLTAEPLSGHTMEHIPHCINKCQIRESISLPDASHNLDAGNQPGSMI